jgi:hypothetical protein
LAAGMDSVTSLRPGWDWDLWDLSLCQSLESVTDCPVDSTGTDTIHLVLACSRGLSVLSNIPADKCREAVGPSTADNIADAYAKSRDLLWRLDTWSGCLPLAAEDVYPVIAAYAIRLGYCVLGCESRCIQRVCTARCLLLVC